MKRGRAGLVLIIGLGLQILRTGEVDAEATQKPKFIYIATNAQGSLFYSLGGVIARAVEGAAGIKARVKPYSGSSACLPAISQGKVDLGINNTNDVRAAYRGIEPFIKSTNIRIISVLCPIFAGIVVKNESDIHTLRDLTGRRVSARYPAQISPKLVIEACLATAGMDWDDVVQIPVTNAPLGVQALIEGRVDAASFAVLGSKIMEADATIRGGVRFLSIEDSPEAAHRLAMAFPGAYPYRLPANAPGFSVIKRDTNVICYDIFVIAGTPLSTDAAYIVTKALYEREGAVQKGHVMLRQFSRRKMVKANVTIPYHEGAVRFYNEVGLWTPEMEKVQKKLLSEAAK